MTPKEIIYNAGLAILSGFGLAILMALVLHWITKLPPEMQMFVCIIVFVGISLSAIIYFALTYKADHSVYICYKIGDSKNINDVRVKAICTNPLIRDSILEIGDCYRYVQINEVLKEPSWEDLNYKTKDGYMTVE